MSDKLFQRKSKVVFPSLGLAFEGLRIKFKIKKTLEKEPNTAEILIYNLSQETRSKLTSKGTRVSLEAGYTTTSAVIFAGDTSFIDHAHQGPDWVTKIECGDGEVAYQNALVSQSFKQPVTQAQVLQHVIGKLGLDSTQALKAIQGQIKQYTSGFVAHGKASAILDRVAKSAGFNFSIQDNRVQLLKPGETTNDPLITLSADSGLVGSPVHGSPNKPNAKGEKKPQTLKVKSLLQPGFYPGRRILINSESIKNGTFYVQTLEHVGDTFGGDWFSELEVLPVTS